MRRMTVVTGLILAMLVIMVLPCSGQVINACYRSNNGQLRIVSDPTECRSSEVAISWNIMGPAGPAGPQGPAGGIDLSKIYISECAPPYETGFCQCENEGEIALSASAGCGALGQVLQYVMRDAETDPTRAWVALCKDLDHPGEYAAPSHFSVTCLRP
jgi:hypothetical protein